MNNCIRIDSPNRCCGCGGCVNACSRNAITVYEDEYGFIFPQVDETLCVDCGKCVSVCAFNDKGRGANGISQVYAAVNKDKEVLKESSSGGIFTALAQAVLDRGGAVFGAAWTQDMVLRHILVEKKEDLARLRGSKYVQSSTGTTFRQVKKLLQEDRWVCYSGTPCQIAGLKAFLGEEQGKLLTVDLVCHGVPSMRMLRDDLDFVTKGNAAKIEDVRFRDKRYGWGVLGSVKCGEKNIKYNAGTSPYYFYFLKGEVYRESCYNCRFPSEERQGDITLGDYWGVRHELIEKMGKVNADLGVSCVLVNTQKGRDWLKSVEGNLAIIPSDRQSAEKRNKQLIGHSEPLPEHKTLRDGYVARGYTAYREGYKKHTKDHIVRGIKKMIPSKIKRKVNDLLS